MLKKVIILLILLTLIAAGCTEKDSTTISTSDGDVDIEYSVPEGANDEWCPVGMTMDAANPQTGEMSSMEVVGTETVDGIEMCKAVLETNTDDEFAKMVYLFSEDGETFEMTTYDAAGNVVSQMSMKDGVMTMTDEEGNVVEYGGVT
ncbi:MAG: hypothetical protein MIO93_01365 [ANME-2 cluster archaeon]|jgi:outer membrane lipoprotein-sorting protein|nr:hypothetical protein [ANME-2 cluster archaeon]